MDKKLSLWGDFIIGLVVYLSFVSCSTEKDVLKKVADYGVNVSSIKEQFDKDDTLKVTAFLSNPNIDSISEYGFIYTDGLTTYNPEPKAERDHTIRSNNLGKIDGFYQFSSLINPNRENPPNSGGASTTSVVAYLKSKKGKMYFSSTRIIQSDKPKILDIFPAYAVAGTTITIALNRSIINGRIQLDTGVEGESTVFILINGQSIPYKKASDYNNYFSFVIPNNVATETSVVLKVGEYEAPSTKKIKNTKVSIAKLTEHARSTYTTPFFFGIGSNIYFGGVWDFNSQVPIKEFHKYNIPSNTWTSAADCAGYLGMSFVINERAYCGGPDNMQQYDPILDQWRKMAPPTSNLKYDHTKSSSATGVVNGKAYFTDFSKEVTFGVTYYNFYSYDPATEVYTNLPAFPGPYGSLSQNLDRAIFWNNELHFFSGLKHFTYNVTSQVWKRWADVAAEGEWVKPFVFQNELYVLHYYINRSGIPSFLTNHQVLRMFRYTTVEDKWIRDSDMPTLKNYHDMFPLVLDGKAYFAVTTYQPNAITILKASD